MTRPDAPWLLGIDIGGTKSAAIVGDAAGRVLARVGGPTPRDWRQAVAFLTECIHQACASCGCAPGDAQRLGISCGGPVESATGTVRRPPNLPDWQEVPLKAIFEAELGLPVAVENDANATALAEWLWGAGRGCQDMAFLTMGTGIGAGLILNGALYRGQTDLAGEIGHVTLLPDGPLCLCGKRGCLEALASGTAIGRIGRERFGDDAVTAETVCARARQGDPVALAILHDAAGWMGLALANLLQTLNLERIVLGTLAVHAGDLLLDPIRAAMHQHCWPRIAEGVSIVPAALGDAAQDMAALAVARQTPP